MHVDDSPLATAVRKIVPGGVDAALDLVGAPTLFDCLHAAVSTPPYVRRGCCPSSGRCPTSTPPVTSVQLTGYTGDATDLPPAVLQELLNAVAADQATVSLGNAFHLEDVREAHRAMENNTAGREDRHPHRRLSRHA
nr:zinc-binding dehydrogenase [Actinopolymorpha singaporensis]